MMARHLLTLVTLRPVTTMQEQVQQVFKLPNLLRPIFCRLIALVMQMKQIVAAPKY